MKVCIYTQKSVEGEPAVPVKEDNILRAIRSIKKFLRIAKMNELYVTKPYLEEHKKRRKSFERSVLFSSIIAGFVILLSIIFPIINKGMLDLSLIFLAFILAGFILALPLFKYTPAIENSEPSIIQPAKSSKTKESVEKAKEPDKEKNRKIVKKAKQKKPAKTKTKKAK